MSPSDSQDDTMLIARCRAGDAAAWPMLVARYQRLVFAVVRRAGLDEHAAADVFQTVFMRLLQHLDRIAEPARLQAWIVTTAKREALLQRRRARREVAAEVGHDATDDDHDIGGTAADGAPGPEQTIDHWQQLMQVREALDRLDPRCRRLLQALFANESVGYDELSRQLDMPVGSIGPTRARCLAKLRRLIE
jgi:RNA polymerase sigma factor (sigma-70 family)